MLSGRISTVCSCIIVVMEAFTLCPFHGQWHCLFLSRFEMLHFHLDEGQRLQVLCLLGLVKCTVRETSCDQLVYISIFIIAACQHSLATSRFLNHLQLSNTFIATTRINKIFVTSSAIIHIRLEVNISRNHASS